jgi:hypothetical protein
VDENFDGDTVAVANTLLAARPLGVCTRAVAAASAGVDRRVFQDRAQLLIAAAMQLQRVAWARLEEYVSAAIPRGSARILCVGKATYDETPLRVRSDGAFGTQYARLPKQSSSTSLVS